MSRNHRSDLDIAESEGLQRLREARIKNGNRVCWCSHELYKHKPVHGECEQPDCKCELFIDRTRHIHLKPKGENNG